MLRRRLCSYTVYFMTGIAAGYFMLERCRYLSAAGLAASVIAIAALAGRYEAAAGRAGMARVIRFRQMLALMFLCGMLAFSVRYALFGLSEAAVSGQTEVRGRIISCVPDYDRLKITVRSDSPWHPGILAVLKNYDPDTDICGLYGSSVVLTGQFKELSGSDNPGCFDYRRYLRGRGICLSFRAAGMSITDTSDDLLTVCRRSLYREREQFIGRFDDETAGFIRGVIFGDKRDIDDELVNEFNENSTGHILAVSGLHMGFLFGLLKILTGKKRTPAVTVTVIAVLVMYGEMTLWSAATIRACLVASMSILSLHLKRRFDLLSSVCLAALCILIKEPYQLFDTGYQLSFLALAGISFTTKPLSSVAGETLGAAAAVQLGTVPAAVYTFNCFEPFALFINIPVILLASVLVPVCIILLIIQIAAGIVPPAGIDLAGFISYAVIKANHLFAAGTGHAVRTSGFTAAFTVLYYILLFGLSSEWARILLLRKKKKELIKQGALVMIPVIMLSSCLYNSFADDELVFVAVGQGDCTHIRVSGRNVLIDGGGDPGYGSDEAGNKTEGYNVGERILMPYLLHSGAERADAALVTHLHADHYKGITELAGVLPVGMIGIPVDYRGNSEEVYGDYDPGRIFYIKPDTRLDISDEVYVEVLWPVTVSDRPLAADDPNEHNTVYMIHYGEVRIMVTGDLLEEDELQMVKHYEGTDRLSCDILKVAHHGSKSSSCEAFLDAAKPRIAVIQCGRNNLYGHPHQQTLDRLRERGIKVFRTDINGAVGIDIRGSRLYVDLFK